MERPPEPAFFVKEGKSKTMTVPLFGQSSKQFTLKVVLRAVLLPFSFISVKDFLLRRKERKGLRKRNVSVESFHSSQAVTWAEPR